MYTKEIRIFVMVESSKDQTWLFKQVGFVCDGNIMCLNEIVVV